MNRLLVPAILLAAACEKGPSMPPGAVPSDQAPAGMIPSAESCIHWLSNHDIDVALPGVASPWRFKREEVSEMKVLWFREQPGDPRKPLLSTVSYQVTTGGKTFTVRGTIGYRKSVQFERMLVYEDYVTEAVEGSP